MYQLLGLYGRLLIFAAILTHNKNDLFKDLL